MAYSTRRKPSRDIQRVSASPSYPPDSSRITEANSSSYSNYPVVVKSLAKNTDKNTLFHNFKEFGKIVPDGVTIKKYPNGKSIAFVNYVELDGARRALAMDGKNIDGSFIDVKLQEQRQRNNSEKEDYQPITDCRFHMEGECTKKNCAYRHPKNTKAALCSSWEGDTCKNVSCPYAHPAKKQGGKVIMQATNNNDNNNLETPTNLKVNSHVEVTINSKKHCGIIKWIGHIPEMNCEVAGIELNQSIEEGWDGIFQRKKYFTCKEKHGYFIATSKCKLSRAPLMNDLLPASRSTTIEYICGFYLKNLCSNGENCDSIHPPHQLPYCWYYQHAGEDEVLVCPKDITEQIEELYRDVSKDNFICAKDSKSIIVNFNNLNESVYEGKHATFKRISTRPSVVASDDEHLTTEWLWYWHDENNRWQMYNIGFVTSDYLEKQYNAYIEKTSPKEIYFERPKFRYKLSFVEMRQENETTHTKREIRRRPNKYIKKESFIVAEQKEPFSDFPVNWKSVPLTVFKLIPVPNDVRSKIERDFATTMGGRMSYVVVSLEEVCNKQLYRQYKVMKKNMEELNKGNVKEKQLWHGTRPNSVNAICQQNFDWRLNTTHACGHGSYFARDASYSNGYSSGDANGVSSMFYADVLVGEYAKGVSTYTRPPVKRGDLLYDSCVDNVAQPSIFVIFNLSQCYPRYLLKYKRTIVR